MSSKIRKLSNRINREIDLSKDKIDLTERESIVVFEELVKIMFTIANSNNIPFVCAAEFGNKCYSSGANFDKSFGTIKKLGETLKECRQSAKKAMEGKIN